MSVTAKLGHLSSSLSYVDILAFLYKEWLDLSGEGSPRDKFVLSKGHGCAALYVAMADCGIIDSAALNDYGKENASLQCHPCRHYLPELAASSGSLGIGMGIATGFAKARKLRNQAGRIVALVGDGECNEGAVWEAAMYAAAAGLDNLYVVVDYNGVQAVGQSDRIMGHTDLGKKFDSFGWFAQTIDGNRLEEIRDAFGQAARADRPSVIVAKSATGVPFMDNDVLWHYRVPSEKEYEDALSHLDAEPIF